MSRPELGIKRVCPTTGRKFYDLNKDPIVSPYTGQVVTIVALPTRGRIEAPVRVEPVAEVETPEAEEPELISLEDAEEEATTGKAVTADAEESEEDETADADTFLEEDEDEEDDVTDLIGDGIDDDEEH